MYCGHFCGVCHQVDGLVLNATEYELEQYKCQYVLCFHS